MIIAVDGVGGDRAPEAIVEGVVWAIREDLVNKILLVGPKELMQKHLAQYDYPDYRIEIVDAPEIVAMDENPTGSLKKKRSSMAVLGELLQQGKAKAAVSAGNTGAYYAHLLFSLRKVPGVLRPAIAELSRPLQENPALSLMLAQMSIANQNFLFSLHNLDRYMPDTFWEEKNHLSGC